MPADVVEETRTQEPDAGPDRVVTLLRWGVIFVVVCIVCVAVYAVITGVFLPPAAPRTQAELILVRSEAAVQANSKDGKAWAQLARAQYLTGKKDEAYATIARARESVEATETPILWVNNQELDMLIRDGRNEEALEKAEGYVETDAQFRVNQRAEELARGIDQPLDAQDAENQTTVELFLLKAQAELNLQKYEAAVESYDNALLMAPLAADILVLRGHARISAGDAEGAREDFETALSYMPDMEAAKAGLAMLDSAAPDTVPDATTETTQ